MSDRNNILDSVTKIKKFLDILKVEYLSIRYDPISHFENKKHYPLDFQIFMEQIGEISISSEPEWNGYSVLNIIRPAKLDQMKENNFQENQEGTPFFWFEVNYNNSSNSAIFNDEILVGDVNFVACEPCNNNTYGFVKDNNKYYFTSDRLGYTYKYDTSNQNLVFLNWFIVCLIDNVDNICSDKVKTIEEYKKLRDKTEN